MYNNWNWVEQQQKLISSDSEIKHVQIPNNRSLYHANVSYVVWIKKKKGGDEEMTIMFLK